MPVTMYTPGYEEENKTKPGLVLKIEESDPGLTPEKAAEGLYEGTVLVTVTFSSAGAENNHICRCAQGRIPHYRYIHRGCISYEHPWVLAVWVERSQRPTFRPYWRGMSMCALVDEYNPDVS
jgi:hypothetical protein